jgi:hypothetical protein
MTLSRPDLSHRTGLSKSTLTDFDMCAQRGWLSLHHPMPWVPNPDMTFGSCVDAGVESLIVQARAGEPLDFGRALATAAEAQQRDGGDVDQDEVEVAVRAFPIEEHDWAYCRTQPHIHVPLFDFGEIDGHPDIVLRTNAVWDVKTSKRQKDTARSLELGTYALMIEEETGEPVPEVGYICWVRLRRPYWQTISTPVTDDFREWTRERIGAYVRAVRADEVLNRGRDPINWSFPGGPKNSGLCRGCRYNPLIGGACRMAVQEGEQE